MGREPLDFRMCQHKRSMSRLIERLRSNGDVFSTPEPNPFAVLDRIREEYGSIQMFMLAKEAGEIEEDEDPFASDESQEEEMNEEERNGEIRMISPLKYISEQICVIL